MRMCQVCGEGLNNRKIIFCGSVATYRASFLRHLNHTHTHTHAHTYTRTHTHTHTCTHEHTHVHAHTHTYIHINTHRHTRTHICTYTHIYTCTHTHIHMPHTHTHIYTCHTHTRGRTPLNERSDITEPLPTKLPTYSRDEYSFPQLDSNLRFQQCSGCRPSP
jgi:hypothetical protein